MPDSSTSNQGKLAIISNNIIRKTQIRPIDIDATSSNTLIFGNRIEDWGKTLSAQAELSLAERIAGIRVRAPNCLIYGNWVGFVDWSRSTTVGKEQLWIVLSYNGNLSIGAENCQVFGNIIAGTLRRIAYDANTQNNYEWGNVGVSVTSGDLDSGTNNGGISLSPAAAGATGWRGTNGGTFLRGLSAGNELITLDRTNARVGVGETVPDYKLDVNGAFGFAPGSSVTPVDNGDVVFQLTSNTQLTIKAKGSDDTVRSANITLA